MFLISFLEQIKNEEIVLPDIQRDFVWNEPKIEKLFDSIISYPIGIVLLWETYNDIQYRHFIKDYRSGTRYAFYENRNKRKLKLVLDGQQRLQSLYVSVYGSNNGKFLYFDILSGRETEDFKEDKYYFYFLTPEQADKWNSMAISDSRKNKDEKGEDYEAEYYCKVHDLMTMGAKQRQKFQKDITKKLELSEEDELRLRLNLSTLHDVLSSDPKILKATVIDENRPYNSPDRKSESDVLEAFVRINTEGTRLSRSDLIFSMLKLNWKESAIRLPEFVDEINKGNSFEIDSDLVIRCLLAVSDLGTKFNIDLRNKSNVNKIRNNYDKCCNAIRSTIDFVQNQCWIASSKLLGGYYNLVPFVYYLFHTKNHQVPNSQTDNVRKTVYLFGFTSPFSRYADSRLGKFIRRQLKPLSEKNDERFPLGGAVYWVWYWENIEKYNGQLIQGNPSLALHLVQHLSGVRVHYEKNAPQIDHIFPRSVLREKGFEEAEINHFANFWILAKNKNQNKSKKHPKTYFADVSSSELKRAYIDKKLFDYRKYRTFLRQRDSHILNHIKNKLDLSDTDYNVRAYYDID